MMPLVYSRAAIHVVIPAKYDDLWELAGLKVAMSGGGIARPQASLPDCRALLRDVRASSLCRLYGETTGYMSVYGLVSNAMCPGYSSPLRYMTLLQQPFCTTRWECRVEDWLEAAGEDEFLDRVLVNIQIEPLLGPRCISESGRPFVLLLLLITTCVSGAAPEVGENATLREVARCLCPWHFASPTICPSR